MRAFYCETLEEVTLMPGHLFIGWKLAGNLLGQPPLMTLN